MINKTLYIFIGVFYMCSLAFCQNENTSAGLTDSLQGKSFDYLKNQSRANADEPERAKHYIEAYLKKAKQQRLDSLILKGYFWQAINSDFEKAISYYDSIISYEAFENKLLVFAHHEKGYMYFTNGNYRKSLESYLEARQIAKEVKNRELFFASTYTIGVIRALSGQNEEALEIFKEQFENFSSDSTFTTRFSGLYLESLFSLADSYITNSKLDSARIFNKLGIKESFQLEQPSYYPRFILSEGTTLYREGNYKKANDSLSKAITLLTELNDSISLGTAYYFNSKIMSESGNLASAIELLKKADTIASKLSIQPDFAPIYEALYENYKKTDSVEQQLIYLEKFIAYNKKLENELKGIDATLYTQYDVPELLDAKEEIILGLQETNKHNQRNIILLSLFLTAFGILSFYYYRKRVIYKKRYDRWFQKNVESAPESSKKPVVSKSSKVPLEILDQLLPKIEEFEKNKGFLDSSLTLNKMAKELGSNSNYLSKTINYTKTKNFSSYLSDLRIIYAIEELKTNPKLLNYTVKAIAFEAGFGNAESFTKAFHAKTNLYPSYFIKQLKKSR